ncbi:NAD(P)-dependent oxidoreductase [Adhaeribacter sp. BT258]|uniref:NAD(P)-dependent oxidoreductase n=1 Tax=Adhaeribacter terrigena TaxID=2793070 RepID=A0ABS1C2L5_9BACT|nr:NAD(P)-dependent oxidoreductase [Adhaeribacter terrigena]MBK0403639.1 NAD(P)-dependent oxidoreductase [Adhaeribacter terrigena]
MKVALIGASGFVGTAILNELLERGHQVTALTRDNANIKKQHENLQVVQANVVNETELAEKVKSHDAVISSFNAGWTNPNLYEDFLSGSKAIQQGVKKSGVKRLIVVGGGGSLYTAEGVQIVDTPEFPEQIKPGATAARDYLNEIKKETDLDWTFLSPALEMHQGTAGVRKGTYRKGLENPVFDENGHSVASVEDTAVALVDELENPQHIRERFTVAY